MHVKNAYAVLLTAVFAASAVFASRYWVGAADGDALYSSEANWSSSRNGVGGATLPGDGTGTTYFYKIQNGRTVFDKAGTAPDKVCVGTRSSDYFVWSATNPAYGLSSTNNYLYVGSAISGACSPANLQIDSGTYNFKYARIGYESGGTADLLLNGGTFECYKAYVGAIGHANGKLTLKGGTFTTTSTSTTDSMTVGGTTNTVASVVVDGGNLVVGGYLSIGYVSNVTALVNVKSGSWTAKGVHVGGNANKQTNYIDHAVARIVVDGGTVSWTATDHSALGNSIGEGSYAEMVVNGGDLTCNAAYFYIGDTGPASLAMNGGTFTMVNANGGYLNLGHQKTGHDVGTLTLNGGTLAVRKLRLDYAQPGSKVVFNGGTLKPIKAATDFIDAQANVTCEVQAGGMVIDTAGYNVEIKHPIVLADGVISAPLVKKGAGSLTLSGSTPFAAGSVMVFEGTAKVGDTTYSANMDGVIDASSGGYLGEVVIHGEPMETWLKDPDFTTYASKYGARGTNSLEQPLTIAVTAKGAIRHYENLETGRTYADTLDGVEYSFTTESLPPRTIKAVAPNGTLIKNIRDVGSWPLVSVDGTAKMKQGMIFRGANLDAFANATAAQKAASALADLKTEIDMRKVGVDGVNAAYQGAAKSWAAVDADYWYCPMDFNDGNSIDTDANGNYTNQVRRVFSRLGTQGALPAYFHCAIGTDRTGFIGMMLLGMMGVEEKTIFRDYLASNFADIGSSRNMSAPERVIRYLLAGKCNSNKYVYNDKDAEYGVSIAARCRRYLEMCGVTEEEIGNITQALSGEMPAQVLERVNAYEAANNVRNVRYVPFPGSSSVSAEHRLPAGEHILPSATPTRSGYVFSSWDTAGESNGVVYATWTELEPRYWADSNGASESFTRAESWDPPPDGEFDPADTLVLNKGLDKVATMSEGSVAADTLYVGWGTLDGGKTTNTSHDHGGRLDVTGGLLVLTNYLNVGGYRSAYSNIVNVTGGCLAAGTLRMGDYYDAKSNGKCDVLRVSGGGVVSNTTGEVQMSIRSGGARSRVEIGGGGSFVSLQNVKLGMQSGGLAQVSMGDEGEMDLSGKNIYLGYKTGSSGELSLEGSSSLRSVYDVVMGYDQSSTGRVEVAGNARLTASHYIYIGRKGDGELAVNGGFVSAGSLLRFGDGASGSSAVLNLNGGTLRVRQLAVSGTPRAVFNWNGGTLECSTYSYADGNMIPDNANLSVNVLEGGAVYNAVVRDNEEIKHPMSGVGALKKTGSKQLTVSGAVDLKGGFVVEEGTLVLSDVTGTEFRRISVAEGAALDLNGAEVTVDEYRIGGARRPGGTYTAHNGTIHVKAAVPAGRKAVVR